jgi:hypothetical protein
MTTNSIQRTGRLHAAVGQRRVESSCVKVYSGVKCTAFLP